MTKDKTAVLNPCHKKITNHRKIVWNTFNFEERLWQITRGVQVVHTCQHEHILF